MSYSIENNFYLDLYWEQLRFARERLIRRINTGLISLSLMALALSCTLIYQAGFNKEVLSGSLAFKAALVFAILIWILLFIHLMKPLFWFSLFEKVRANRSHDMLCREIALNKDKATYQKILESSPHKNRGDRLGKTPLFYLARTNQFELVKKYLTVDKSLVNQKDVLGETPFIEALRSGHSQIINYMLELNPQYRNGFTPIMAIAATQGKDFLNQALITTGANQDVSADGTTAILIAARAKQFANVDLLMDKYGQCMPDRYASHPLDWVISSHSLPLLKKMIENFDNNFIHSEFLDHSNNSLLHKAILNDFPQATQLLRDRSQKALGFKNVDRKTALDLALSLSKSDSRYQTHVAILQNQGQVQMPSGQSTQAGNQNAFQNQSFDFDDLAVSLEMSLSGFSNGESFVTSFTSDLRHFYENRKSQFQVWIGKANVGKKARAKKILEVLSTSPYSDVFQTFRVEAHEHTETLLQLAADFADKSKYPDNGVVMVESADMFLDPKEGTIDPRTHGIFLKKLDSLMSQRKLLFIFIGSFKHRSVPLTKADRYDLFGDDLAPFFVQRYFHPPEIISFLTSIEAEYEAQDLKSDDDGLILLIRHCVSNHISKDGFFVLLKEIHHSLGSRANKNFTLEEVSTYLENA